MIYIDEDKNISMERYRSGWVVKVRTERVSSRERDKGKIITSTRESFHANIKQVSSHLIDVALGDYSVEKDSSLEELITHLEDLEERLEEIINKLI